MLKVKNILKGDFLPILFIIIIIATIFKPFILHGNLPIPADTIVGLYHPYRDFFSKDYPRGIPFKNFLITDPVRQQFPWRWLSVDIYKSYNLPLWNPYNMAGSPLLANFQSAVFYPLNLLFLGSQFSLIWSILVFLQPILAGILLYLYLINLKINKWSSLFAGIVFSFSGFATSWLEWNTVMHSGLWLPLILLSIDKLSFNSHKNKGYLNLWSFIYLFSLISAFFAGHLQTFFYLYIFQFVYFILRLLQLGKIKLFLIRYIFLNLIFVVFTAVQWYPTLQLIELSARNIDLIWTKPGWFIPWQHLIQFVIPDFFGNPSTLNYWGEWNYGEFIGYIGIVPLVFAITAILYRHDNKTKFYAIVLFFTLLFALPTFFSKIPYILSLPFISTAQPTRLLFLTDFSLAVLAGLGFDYYMKTRRNYSLTLIFFTFIFVGVAYLIFSSGGNYFNISAEDLSVTKRNSYIPFAIFVAVGIIFISRRYLPKKFSNITIFILIFITLFDLGRFTMKYLPFTDKNYLYPNTKVFSFLKENIGVNRAMSLDSRILPPNFSIMYKIQSIEGYDPLYLLSYGEFISALERNRPDIKPPFGFNRIITAQNYSSNLIDLLGVKYILSLNEINNEKLVKVFQEGDTRVYENMSVLPRVFFVNETIVTTDKQNSINILFKEKDNFLNKAVIDLSKFEKDLKLNRRWASGSAKIESYTENKIVISTNVNENGSEAFMVFTDSFYPTWKVEIINSKTNSKKQEIIYKTDYNFRGVVVPSGKSKVIFYNTLF